MQVCMFVLCLACGGLPVLSGPHRGPEAASSAPCPRLHGVPHRDPGIQALQEQRRVRNKIIFYLKGRVPNFELQSDLGYPATSYPYISIIQLRSYSVSCAFFINFDIKSYSRQAHACEVLIPT